MKDTWQVEPSGPLRGDIGVRGGKNAVTKLCLITRRKGAGRGFRGPRNFLAVPSCLLESTPG